MYTINTDVTFCEVCSRTGDRGGFSLVDITISWRNAPERTGRIRRESMSQTLRVRSRMPVVCTGHNQAIEKEYKQDGQSSDEHRW